MICIKEIILGRYDLTILTSILHKYSSHNYKVKKRSGRPLQQPIYHNPLLSIFNKLKLLNKKTYNIMINHIYYLINFLWSLLIRVVYSIYMSKFGFRVPFNSQGHIGTGPQLCHLWEPNPHRWVSKDFIYNI